ncbi:hypothetical protein ACIA8F_33740 [Streptomyces sp. NPDC051563]|uniref:hypothetical protein n=1 Tax=Streptomyces sp. NPDC051563 TaxID=3365659 RepID=UPI0037874D7B
MPDTENDNKGPFIDFPQEGDGTEESSTTTPETRAAKSDRDINIVSLDLGTR